MEGTSRIFPEMVNWGHVQARYKDKQAPTSNTPPAAAATTHNYY
jgi:hypothetical protein